MISDLRYQIFMATLKGRRMDREEDWLTEVLERLAGRPMLPPPVQQFRAPSIMDKEILSILSLALRR